MKQSLSRIFAHVVDVSKGLDAMLKERDAQYPGVRALTYTFLFGPLLLAPGALRKEAAEQSHYRDLIEAGMTSDPQAWAAGTVHELRDEAYHRYELRMRDVQRDVASGQTCYEAFVVGPYGETLGVAWADLHGSIRKVKGCFARSVPA